MKTTLLILLSLFVSSVCFGQTREEFLENDNNSRFEFGSGTLWKYAQTVGPAYLGAPTHPGKKKEVKEYSKI